MKRGTHVMAWTLRRHRRKVVLFLVSALFASTSNAVADEGAESQPQEPVMVQLPPPEEVELPNDYPRRLPKGRGSGPDVYLDPAGLEVPLPDASVVQALDPNALLPTVLGAVPRLDLDELVGGLVQSLPPVDTSGLQESVDGLVDTVIADVEAIAAELTSTARGIAEASAAAPANESDAADPDPTKTAFFHLKTTASGVTQTFTLPLCVPTPINIASTSPTPATTIVSLCPVPLGITTAPIVPPAGQPAQLYLSVNQIPGTSRPPATFTAGYTIQEPTSGAQATLNFGLASTSQAYPTAAVVGAATDWRPTPTQQLPGAQYIPEQAVINASMSWSMSSRADTVSVELVGRGKVALNSVTESNGSFTITIADDKTAFHLVDSVAPPRSANTSIVVTSPRKAKPGETKTASLTWSNLPQEFVFNARASEGVKDRPTEMAFDGTQAVWFNPSFTFAVDSRLNGQLAGRFTQSGLGGQYSTQVTLNEDEGENVNGFVVKSAPGVISTAALSSYKNGALAAFAQLGAMPAEPSEVTVQLHGTIRAASAGVTVSGSNAPRYIGVNSFIEPSGAAGGPKSSMVFSRGPTPAGLPFAPVEGGLMALRVTEVDPTFKIDIHATGAAGAVTGVDVSGSTPGPRTAAQFRLRAVSEGSRTATLLMNQLGPQWAYKMNLHQGATGVDISDVNSTATPGEYKELIIRNAGTVTHSLIVKRAGSDLSGASAAAGMVATVTDPPQSFDVSIDFSGHNVTGAHCSQVLRLQGRSATASNGSITLSAVAGGAPISVSVLNDFVVGDWSVGATAAGPSTTCVPDTITFDMHQGIGANPAGRLTVTAGVGTIDIRSFSTTEKVTVKLIPGATGGVAGARIDGTNSEPNPGMAIKLLQKNGSTVQSALNIFAGSGGIVENGVVTAVLTNTPQNFGIALQRFTDPNTKLETLEVGSYNQAPAPAETLRITAPAAAPANGKVQFVVRSLDTASVVRFGVAPPAGQSFNARIQNQNVNPNATQAISAAILTAGGTPEYTMLFYRPSADLTGLPTGGTKASSVWERMPQSFDLDLAVAIAPGARKLTMKLANSQANPNGVLRLYQPESKVGVAFTGTGATQTFNVDSTSAPESSSAHLTGNVPPGMGNVQISKVNNTWEDVDLWIYRSGYTTLPTTNRGTFMELDPRGEDFNLSIEVKGREAKFAWRGPITESQLTIAQFYQPDPFHTPCYSGSYVACNDLNLVHMPKTMDLTAAPGSEGSMVPTFDYKASDSNLLVDINTLNSYVQLAYMPSKGFTMTGGVSTATGVNLAMAAVDPAERLPMFYFDQWNIHLPINVATPFNLHAPLAGGGSVAGYFYAAFDFVVNVTFHGDPGLKTVAVTSPTLDVPNPDGSEPKATWAGLLGFEAVGDAGAEFGMYLGLQLNPGPQRLGWGWDAYSTGFADRDEAAFTWDNLNPYPIDRNGLGITFYTWEARPNDSRRYAGTGCGSSTVINPDAYRITTATPAVPFSPTFARINNGAKICAGHVAYYQFNFNDLMFKRSGFFGPGGGDVWSNVDMGAFVSDWILAAALKRSYGNDPSKLTVV